MEQLDLILNQIYLVNLEVYRPSMSVLNSRGSIENVFLHYKTTLLSIVFSISPKPSLNPPPPTSSEPRSEIWLDFQKSGPETKIWGHLAQNAMQNPIFSPAALYSACLKAFPPCIEC